MTSEQLTWAIWALTAGAWAGALFLVRKALEAHIGALTERAIVAVGIAIFGTVYSLAVFNSDIGQLLANDTVKFYVRLAVVLLLTLPIIWAFLYRTGRLGDDGKGGE